MVKLGLIQIKVVIINNEHQRYTWNGQKNDIHYFFVFDFLKKNQHNYDKKAWKIVQHAKC